MQRATIQLSLCSVLIVSLRPLASQTTYGLITGVVRDAITQEAVPSATVRYSSLATGQEGSTSAREGIFTISSLSPGTYSITVEASGYQDRAIEQLDLLVAGHFDIRFELWKLSDPWHAGAYSAVELPRSHAVASYYGPDINTSRPDTFEPVEVDKSRLETAVSTVIDTRDIDELPLTGRDVYTALVLMPGVNSDPAATRGLGFSVNGQRPSSSSFLLDGVESNNYLISGPLLTPAPEAVQEYRASTSNFSAEYGGTSGYIANAVTRASGPRWAALLYLVGMNEILNANGFQENFRGYPRPAFKQLEPGFRAGGPLWPQVIFVSNAFEYLRLRTRLDPQSYLLPTAATIAGAGKTESSNLLKQYPAIAAPVGLAGDAQTIMLAPPSSLNQYHILDSRALTARLGTASTISSCELPSRNSIGPTTTGLLTPISFPVSTRAPLTLRNYILRTTSHIYSATLVIPPVSFSRASLASLFPPSGAAASL
jgi:hypothetical protein